MLDSCIINLNKMQNYIKAHKDIILSKSSRKNVIYKINCNNYDASYVGQTGRQLNTRMPEHWNHIRRNTSHISVITDHRFEFNHDFDWDEMKEPFG